MTDVAERAVEASAGGDAEGAREEAEGAGPAGPAEGRTGEERMLERGASISPYIADAILWTRAAEKLVKVVEILDSGNCYDFAT